jgi:hypothetical protein
MGIKTKDLRTGDVVMLNGRCCVVAWKSDRIRRTKKDVVNVVVDIIDSEGMNCRKTIFQAGIEYELNAIRC